MLRKVVILSFITFLLFPACRSDFEMIRISGNAEKMYEEANKYFEEGDYSKALTLYEMIIPSFRGKSEAEDIAYNFAYGHYLNGSHVLSSHYFKSFADTYSASARKEEALFLSAMSYYKLSPRYKLDQSDSQKAIDALQLFVNSYPESERIATCNEYIDNLRQKMEIKEFEAGKLYFNTGNYSSAIRSLENMLKDFPDTERGEEARFLIAKASYDWAKNSIFVKKEERYKKTVESCNLYLKRHPSADRSNEVLDYLNNSEEELKNIQNG